MVDLAHSLILEYLSIGSLGQLLQLHEDDLAGASSDEDSSLELSDLPNVIDAFAINIEWIDIVRVDDKSLPMLVERNEKLLIFVIKASYREVFEWPSHLMLGDLIILDLSFWKIIYEVVVGHRLVVEEVYEKGVLIDEHDGDERVRILLIWLRGLVYF